MNNHPPGYFLISPAKAIELADKGIQYIETTRKEKQAKMVKNWQKPVEILWWTTKERTAEEALDAIKKDPDARFDFYMLGDYAYNAYSLLKDVKKAAEISPDKDLVISMNYVDWFR